MCDFNLRRFCIARISLCNLRLKVEQMKNLTTNELAKLQETHEHYTLDQALDAIYWLYHVQDVVKLDDTIETAITTLQQLTGTGPISNDLPHGNLAVIRKLFATARANGLEWPTLRLGTELNITLKSNRNGKINITNGKGFNHPNNVWYGAIKTNGQIQFRRLTGPQAMAEFDLIEQTLKQFNDNPPAFAQMQGHKTGACMYCGRKLDNAQSVTAGYGPICASKFGLPWGDLDLSGKQNEMEVSTHD